MDHISLDPVVGHAGHFFSHLRRREKTQIAEFQAITQ